MFDEIRRAGQELDERWQSRDHDRDAFPDLARQTLTDLLARTPITLDGVLEHLASLPEWPEQLHASTAFGEPAISVYRSPAFAIEFYFWVSPVTAIHNHSFSGAFTVIEGLSLERTFSFSHGVQYGRGVTVGRLDRRSVELVGPRVVQTIQPGEALVHQVIHVTRPTLSMIIRTSHDDRVSEQVEYWECGLALAAQETLPPPERRKLDLMRYFARTGHAHSMDLVARIVRRSRDLVAAWCLIRYFDATGGARDAIEAILSQVPAPALPWRGALLEALEDRVSMSRDWSILNSEPHRLLAALSSQLSRRDEIDEVLRAYCKNGEPASLIVEWVSQIRYAEKIADAASRLRGQGTGLVNVDLDPKQRTILRELLSGRTPEEIARSWSLESDGGAAPDAREIAASLGHFRRVPLLRPLLTIAQD